MHCVNECSPQASRPTAGRSPGRLKIDVRVVTASHSTRALGAWFRERHNERTKIKPPRVLRSYRKPYEIENKLDERTNLDRMILTVTLDWISHTDSRTTLNPLRSSTRAPPRIMSRPHSPQPSLKALLVLVAATLQLCTYCAPVRSISTLLTTEAIDRGDPAAVVTPPPRRPGGTSIAHSSIPPPPRLGMLSQAP
jgi:hypothetical protein